MERGGTEVEHFSKRLEREAVARTSPLASRDLAAVVFFGLKTMPLQALGPCLTMVRELVMDAPTHDVATFPSAAYVQRLMSEGKTGRL